MFQRSNYRLPLNPSDNPKPKPKRIVTGVDLPEYMHEKTPEGPDLCPFCGSTMPDDIKMAAWHILRCARDDKRRG
jgi:hypothetical protein